MMLRGAAPLLLACALPAQEQAAQSRDLQAELNDLVALPDPDARRAQAGKLAKDRDTTLDQWLAAMAAFAPAADERRAAGTRSVTLPAGEVAVHVPAKMAAGPAPLLLVGHGTGGHPRRAIERWLDVAEQLGMLVVAEGGASDEGWGFTAEERDKALGALRWARRTFDVDENRIYVSGVSRGGHMTWDLILRHPDHFAGAAPMVGGPRLNIAGGQNNLRYLENVVHLPIRDLQGDRDDPLLIANLALAFDRLEKLGATDARWIRFPEYGHSFDFDTVDWSAFFGGARRDPCPRRVVRMAARRDEARAFWVEILAFEKEVDEEFRPRVDARVWDRLDDTGKRAHLAELALGRTARLQVEMERPGRFAAEGTGVRRFRLLLTAAMLDEDGRVEVRWKGRTVRRKPKHDAAALLREFADRFDRTFLPVCEVTVP